MIPAEITKLVHKPAYARKKSFFYIYSQNLRKCGKIGKIQ